MEAVAGPGASKPGVLATLQRGQMLEDARIQMRAIFGLGRCAYAAGKLTDATRLYHQARRMAEQTGDALARSEAAPVSA